MIPNGIYRHYKGPLYQVLGCAQNSSNGGDDDIYVIYIPLELERGHAGLRTRLRLFMEFTDRVHDGTGSRCRARDLHCPDAVDRFVFLGPSLTHEMIEHRLMDRGDH